MIFSWLPSQARRYLPRIEIKVGRIRLSRGLGTRELKLVRDDKLKGARMATPRSALLAWAIAVTATFSGCVSVASVQDWHYAHVNKARASSAWFENHDSDQRKYLGCDYEAGYKSGFFDAATGKDCRLPPVPPAQYWAAKYQCCEGQTCVQNWFKGYQAGLAAAQNCGYPAFNDVPVSPSAPVINKTACGQCYSSDACECSEGNMVAAPGSTPAAMLYPAPDAAASYSPLDQSASISPVSLGLIGPADLSASPARYQSTY